MANEDKRIKAIFELDASGFNSGLKGINSGLRNADAQMKLASQGLKKFGNDSTKLKSVQEALTKQVELQSKKVDVYRKAMESADKKMQENIKNRDKLKTSLDQANKKYEEAVKVYGKESTEAKKAKEEVDRLTQEHKKASQAVETNAKSIQNNDTNMKKAQATMQRTEAELRRIEAQLARNNNKWIQASEKLKVASEKFKKVGGAMQSAGDGILKLTAPLVAGGIASLKFSTDFEDSIAKVSTISNEAQVPIGELRKGILKLSNDTGIAATEIANNTYDAISAGQETGDAINFVTESTKLAKAGFADAGQSLDLLTTILNSYKLKSEDTKKVSDMLITTQNLGKVTVQELSASMGAVIPTATATNTKLEQVTAGYALMTKNGIKCAESTTYMNSMLNDLSKTGTDADKALRSMSGKGFGDLMKEGKNLSDVLNMLNDYAKKNNLSLKDMFGRAEAGKAALVLSTNAGKDFNEMLGAMNNSAGATDEAFKKVENTTGERWKKSLNEMKNTAIQFGDAIAPLMDRFSQITKGIAEKLKGLSDEQKKSIVNFTLMAVAVGGFLKIGGKAVSGIGSFLGILGKISGGIGTATLATQAAGTATAGAGASAATAGISFAGLSTVLLPVVGILGAVGVGMYAVHKKNEYMNKSCIAGTEEIGKFGEAITLFTGQTAQSADQLDRNNIKYKDWNEKISPKTRKELTKLSGKISDFGFTVERAKGVKDLIKSDEGKELNSKLDNITKNLIQKIKDEQPKVQTEMSNLFKLDDGKIDANEKKLLDAMKKTGDKEIAQVQKIKKDILELEKKATKETGEQRNKTMELIKQKGEELGQIELKYTVKNNKELELAQAQFNARIKNIDMQGMSNLLKEKAKQRDAEKKKITQDFDTKIEMLKIQATKMGAEEKKIAEKEIKKLEEKKAQAIKIEDSKYNGFLESAKKKYPQLNFYINQKNGEMLTKQEQQKVVELAKYGEKVDGLLGITKTGYYQIWDETKKKMYNCYVEVDKATGQITGAWDQGTNQIYGNPVKAREDIDKDLKNGQKFQPIKQNYNKTQQDIWNNAIKVQATKDFNLFDWVKDAWKKEQEWLNSNPFAASMNKVTASGFDKKWTGTNYFKGGVTALHDTPGQNSNYELYDLPRGTRIFNHDASADLVQKTAENVATKVANSVLSSFSSGNNNNSNQTIIVPVNLDGREIARVTAKPMNKELAKLNRRGL